MKVDYLKLADNIVRAGKIIAKDSINKDYFLGEGYKDTIYVTSDSGFEAIVIGDVSSKNSNGYMYLYYNNTSKRNSFPSKEKIAELLENVANCIPLKTGEGKASYFDWEEYGGLEKQRKYFSDVVKKMAMCL